MTELHDATNTFQRLVRGDAMIGILSWDDEQAMGDTLRRLAHDGSAEAYRWLGDCYAANVQPVGAYGGMAVTGDDDELWAPITSAIHGMSVEHTHALRAWYEAARRGDRQAATKLGQHSRYGNVPTQRLALECLQAVDEPSGAELLLCGWIHLWLGEHEASLAFVRRAADTGHPPALFELSLMVGQGLGTDADPEEAAHWQQLAAEAGDARALYNRAAARATGRDGAVDLPGAAADYERAAEAGHGKAAATLAVMQLQGEVPGDAVAWLDRAEALGFPAGDLLAQLGLVDPRS
jgi:TPR repeat protein